MDVYSNVWGGKGRNNRYSESWVSVRPGVALRSAVGPGVAPLLDQEWH